MLTPPLTAVAIAGFDPTGGAGVLVDASVFRAFGFVPAAALTCHIPQDVARVTAVHPVSSSLFAQQIISLDSLPSISVVKVGALASGDVLEQTGRFLDGRPGIPRVVDPVLRASDGTPFLPSPLYGDFLRTFGKIGTILTPNRKEAYLLAGAEESRSTENVARELLRHGFSAVLIKSAAADDATVKDLLSTSEDPAPEWLESPRLPMEMPHGSGCHLSSALAAHLARGLPLREAIRRARRWFADLLEFSIPETPTRRRFGLLPSWRDG